MVAAMLALYLAGVVKTHFLQIPHHFLPLAFASVNNCCRLNAYHSFKGCSMIVPFTRYAQPLAKRLQQIS
jgi:hypothetical protein